MIKNIFFDFDGVIVESVNVKTEAFRELYNNYGIDIVNKVVKHHRANGGMSRYEKFKIYHNKYLKINIDDKGVKELSSKFSEIVLQGVIDAPEVAGSHDFLHEFKNSFNMFVITGTPTEESKKICKVRGINDCFKGIFGSPQKKDYWCNHIINTFNLKREETIFAGDAFADYSAATKTNIKFFLRDYEENTALFSAIKNIVRFNDFIDLKRLIFSNEKKFTKS